MGKRELIALLNLSSWCLVMVERLFLAVPRGCLQFVIVVFLDHTHLLFLLLSGGFNLDRGSSKDHLTQDIFKSNRSFLSEKVVVNGHGCHTALNFGFKA